MKGDFTRSTFRPDKNYSGVRMQQGRVQLDADWNEQIDLQAYRQRVALGDAGLSGAPDAEQFRVRARPGPAGTLVLTPGRYYVSGTLCENHAEAQLGHQPYLPGVALPDQPGRYLVYLEVWERHVSALEDPSLREVALGGPDTATRSQTVWQVRLQPVDADVTRWRLHLGRGRGRMRAQARAAKDGVPGGYSGPENQLYRIEIHAPAAGQATPGLKWSRDNACLAAAVADADGLSMQVADHESDKLRSFGPRGFVELTSQGRELRGEPGLLGEIDRVEGMQMFVKSWADGQDPRQVIAAGEPCLMRLWNGYERALRPGLIDLGHHGVQVQFEEGLAYQPGDYWLAPARTATQDVEWGPGADGTDWHAPDGIERRYEALALVERDAGGAWRESADLRRVFEPLRQRQDHLHVAGLFLGRPDAPDSGKTPLREGDAVPLDHLTEGLYAALDAPVSSPPGRAAVMLSIEPPYDPRPLLEDKWDLCPGYREIRLAAEPAPDKAAPLGPWVHFRPAEVAVRYLARVFDKGWPAQEPKRMLAWFVLRCRQIYRTDRDRTIFLEGDEGTFHVWFWITPGH